jgi:hypothetical protein
MRKIVSALAVVGVMLFAAPASADIIWTPVPVGDGFDIEAEVGVFYPPDTSHVYSMYVTSNSGVPQSEIIHVTWAIHAATIFYNAAGLHWSFVYDNSSLEVVAAGPIGPWTVYEGPTTWPNPSSGIVEVPSLFVGFTVTSEFVPFEESIAQPFWWVDLHVKSAQYSQINFAAITMMTLFSHTYNITLTPDEFNYGIVEVHEIPEPSVAILAGGGILALGGGLIRRKRRA